MNAEKIKDLRELVAAATPGPWNDTDGAVLCDFGFSEEDSDLITAAVNSLPALLDEVEALRTDAERYRFIRDGKSRGDVDLCICIAHWTEEPVLYSVQAEERADTAIDAARHEPKDAE
jgi:hypothetical protein